MINRILIFIFDLINGIRSNIPFCCVWFFSKRTLSGDGAIGLRVHAERHNGDTSAYDSDNINYIRCDKCHKANVIADVNFENGSILKFMTKGRNKLT